MLAAIRTVVIADAVMSLDNAIAIAAAKDPVDGSGRSLTAVRYVIDTLALASAEREIHGLNAQPAIPA